MGISMSRFCRKYAPRCSRASKKKDFRARRGFVTNDGFAGFSAFDPAHDYAADFARYLRAPGRRHLIMCHPGTCDEELVAADPVTLSRERELSFLLSPAFTAMLDRKRARLARLSDALCTIR